MNQIYLETLAAPISSSSLFSNSDSIIIIYLQLTIELIKLYFILTKKTLGLFIFSYCLFSNNDVSLYILINNSHARISSKENDSFL